MDIEILEQLKNISAQLEKITKLLEAPKPAPFKRDGFPPRRDFGNKKPFGDKKGFGKPDGFHPRKPRFDDNGKPRVVADGRGFDRFKKRF